MTCPICNGSGERDGEYGLLSCTAPNCTAATERAALEAANKAAEPMTVYDQRWFAYKMGKSVQKPLKVLRWLMPDGSCTADKKYGEGYGGVPLYGKP